jgi:hypothetical protein
LVNGGLTTATTRIRSSDYIDLNGGNYTISFSGLNYVALYVYDTSNNFISSESLIEWSSSNVLSFALNGERHIKFVFRRADDGNIPSMSISRICST